MVERLLQSGLDDASPGSFAVRSAGTGALVDRGMTPQIAGLVRVLGGSDANFVSRQLTPDVLRDQNLVLALTRDHRSKILERAPTMLRRTFTLREFARMVDFIASSSPYKIDNSFDAYDKWEQLIPLASAVRHEVMASPIEDDVVDPYRRSDGIHQQMVGEIVPAVRSLLSFVKDG